MCNASPTVKRSGNDILMVLLLYCMFVDITALKTLTHALKEN